MSTIIYFSPTGNTKYLAKKLALNLNGEQTTILALDKVIASELKKDTHLILMFPIHGFNAPRTVKRFVKEIPKELYDDVSLIAVGCNTLWLNDGASLDLKRQFIKKGYQIIVDEVLAMPLTFIMSFPDEAIQKLFTESEQEIKQLSKKIQENSRSDKKVKLKSKLIHTIGKAE